jgi:hypothetical protein
VVVVTGFFVVEVEVREVVGVVREVVVVEGFFVVEEVEVVVFLSVDFEEEVGRDEVAEEVVVVFLSLGAMVVVTVVVVVVALGAVEEVVEGLLVVNVEGPEEAEVKEILDGEGEEGSDLMLAFFVSSSIRLSSCSACHVACSRCSRSSF